MTQLNIPVHISIIMDGNGRWAKQQGKERLYGHIAGTESVRDCCEYAAEIGVKYLSLFAFSEENWSRPESEVSGLMSLMAKSILEERETFRKNNIRFIVVGDRSRLSAGLLEKIDEAMEETKNNTGLSLVIFLSYGGKWDIVQAAERYMRDCLEQAAKGETLAPLSSSSFEKYLSTCGIPDPDLLIRTSGEKRISNFLLWQCAYTEFYFTETLWPDFRRNHLNAAIANYNLRERRFGKTSAQTTNKLPVDEP